MARQFGGTGRESAYALVYRRRDPAKVKPVHAAAAPEEAKAELLSVAGAPELPLYWLSEIERFNKELEDERTHYENES